MTSFNVISDLHLECNAPFEPSNYDFKKADYLAILGDLLPAAYLKPVKGHERLEAIHRKLTYLMEVVFPKYKKVFFVPGNHDYYHSIYSDVVPAYRRYFEDVKNFVVLDNNYELVEDEHIAIVGCTLWTDFNDNNPMDKLAVQHGLADYFYIDSRSPIEKPTDGRITPDFILQKHYESKNYIDYVCKGFFDHRIVVLTHHAPSWKCIQPKYKMSLVNAGFASDLDNFIMTHANIKLWAYGHTHYDKDFMLHDTRIYSHQCGYEGMDAGLYENFKPDKIITV